MKVNGNSVGKMTKEVLCVFRWDNFELSEGENKIEVVGIIGSKKANDSCVWKLTVG